MTEIHHLVALHGRAKARALVSPDEIPLVDLAARALADESGAMGITYSGFCLTALPHRRLPDEQEWIRHNGRFSMMVEPGKTLDRHTRQPILVGVPYGPKARLILIYLQTEAVKEQSRTVEIGRSMHDWLKRMDVTVCKKNYETVRDQAERLSVCRLTFQWSGDSQFGVKRDHFLSGTLHFHDDGPQESLWKETVELGEAFFKALKEHPVPVWEPAIKALAQKSFALDIYVWLAYRLHVLQKATPISWAALYEQFGTGYKMIRQFRPNFITNLRFALAVYPDAKVDFTEAGVVLHPSPAPIPARLIGRQ